MKSLHQLADTFLETPTPITFDIFFLDLSIHKYTFLKKRLLWISVLTQNQ